MGLVDWGSGVEKKDLESAARLLAQKRFRKIEARIEAKNRPDWARCDLQGSVGGCAPASVLTRDLRSALIDHLLAASGCP